MFFWNSLAFSMIQRMLAEKAMATHFSTLAWKIPWTEEPGGQQSMGSLRWRQTWLSNFTFTFHFHELEEEMATHSSVLAWRIPGTAEPGGLPSMGLHRVGHDWSDLAVAVAADVGNLISGSSAFSKTSLNIRKFTVHVLLKTGLENFEHYFTSIWDECNCVVVWAFFREGNGTPLQYSCLENPTDGGAC